MGFWCFSMTFADGEGLARAGHAQQRLVAQTLGQAFGQLLDGDGLVARGLEVGYEPEVRHRNLGSVEFEYTART